MAGWDLVAMLAAAAAFLAVETVLFLGSATFNRAEDEVWLRRTLASRSFYGTELGVLFIGGLLTAVWTAGPWFILLLLPIYALVQRAALHEPLRERAEAAAQLASKNAELELANQFKIDLLGMLGHEIGNPLTAIVGYAQVGADALDDGAVELGRESLTVVERNAAQIQQVVHEILTLVSSERGALTAHPEPCPLEPHLQAAASSQPQGCQPCVECPAGLAALVQPSHLDQILANLVGNAAKYAGGANRITARSTPAGLVEVGVVDSGPGVPPAFREHLFQRFARDADTAQQVMGTGLGLFIARELARANNGDVVLRDGDPSGSVFVLTLPESA
jgi:signal transduction histidine kinase